MRNERSEPRRDTAAPRGTDSEPDPATAQPTEKERKPATRPTAGSEPEPSTRTELAKTKAATKRPATDKEQGSATVLAAAVTAALLVSAVAFIALGQASAARHRAQGAADAAALAGAAKVLFGEGEACAAAQEMVERSEAEFQGCEVNELEVTVHVDETPNGLPAAFGPARAVSRAGPVAVE
jgi:secretion/DNA translocation related TadE-like protein